MNAVRAEIVKSARQRREFISLPKRLYADCPKWVPPFDTDLNRILTRAHPFFEHSEGEFFLFRNNQRVVGRGVVLANERYNRQHGVQSAHFYFVDFEDDEAASASIFTTFAEWTRKRSLDTLMGPLFSGGTMGGGVLVEGFEHRAAMTMMGYNYPYYGPAFEAAGFRKRFDLLSLAVDPREFAIPERVEALADMVRKRGRLAIAPVRNKRDLKRVADDVAALYNPTIGDHAENYPLTDSELNALKKDLLLIAQPELEKIVRYDGEIVGFLFTFPDLTEAMQRNGGKLGPLRILRLLREGGRTRKVLFNGMGILEKYQRLGGNALLYSELVRSIRGTGKFSFEEGEIVQINESTDLMLRDMQTLGARPFKRHRVYELGVKQPG